VRSKSQSTTSTTTTIWNQHSKVHDFEMHLYTDNVKTSVNVLYHQLFAMLIEYKGCSSEEDNLFAIFTAFHNALYIHLLLFPLVSAQDVVLLHGQLGEANSHVEASEAKESGKDRGYDASTNASAKGYGASATQEIRARASASANAGGHGARERRRKQPLGESSPSIGTCPSLRLYRDGTDHFHRTTRNSSPLRCT